ncbi:GCN5 family acetyltransferase [Corynebacterium stationis]|uniref:acetyltransferase n=1 Tax=Corynebacterium stationis TaxID=1705 RepID=UPI000950A581|nr:acetyltransferase [Corynebacterium stationis]APT95547.1 GCN5 family acetyltransferase [Corynebacterium stationis]
MNVQPINIRPSRGSEEFPLLVDIWRSAVLATHDFLPEADRAAIESKLASDYFPAVTLTVAELNGHPVGFSGVLEGNLEMLFIDNNYRGAGIGTMLLNHAISDLAVTKVDVNEQNTQAAEFYLRRGFQVASRSETDEAGRPYPLLHLKL